jgi:hypothetical protein
MGFSNGNQEESNRTASSPASSANADSQISNTNRLENDNVNDSSSSDEIASYTVPKSKKQDVIWISDADEEEKPIATKKDSNINYKNVESSFNIGNTNENPFEYLNQNIFTPSVRSIKFTPQKSIPRKHNGFGSIRKQQIRNQSVAMTRIKKHYSSGFKRASAKGYQSSAKDFENLMDYVKKVEKFNEEAEETPAKVQFKPKANLTTMKKDISKLETSSWIDDIRARIKIALNEYDKDL